MANKTNKTVNKESAKEASKRNPAGGFSKENTEGNEAVTAFRKKLGGGCM